MDGKIILESYEVDCIIKNLKILYRILSFCNYLVPEYQGECEEIAKKKVLLAFEKVLISLYKKKRKIQKR